MRRERTVIAVLAVASGFVQTAAAPSELVLTPPVVPGTIRCEVPTIKGLPNAFSIELPINGVTQHMDLEAVSVRHDGFLLLRDSADGIHALQAPPPATYRGVIRGQENSLVAVSLHQGRITGMIDAGKGRTFFVQPTADTGPEHMVYRSTPHAIANACGAHPALTTSQESLPDAPEGLAGSLSRVLKLTVDTDFEFFLHHAENVTDAVNDIESVINVANAIYQRDVDLRLLLATIILRIDPADPYEGTTTSDLLCEAVNEWDEVDLAAVRTDAVQLMSGKELEGPIGTAYLNSVCSGDTFTCNYIQYFAVSVVEAHYTNIFDHRVALVAHEIGHGLGGSHCSSQDCHIMCPTIGSCDGALEEDLRFGPQAQAEITNFIAGADCLDLVYEPLTPPFLDDFEEGFLLPEHWIHSRHAEVNYSGSQEPSGIQSASLVRTVGGVDDVPGEMMTQAIALDRHEDGTVSFFAQHYDDLENDHTLKVEYRARNGLWKLLHTVQPDQVSNSHFTQFTIALPEDAHWDEFQLRFGALLSGGGFEFWSIDLLEVTATEMTTPLNDECVGATLITDGLGDLDTTGATNSEPGTAIECEAESLVLEADTWYEYVASCTGEFTISTCALTNFDARIIAYTAGHGCPDNPAEPIGCSTSDFPHCSDQLGSELVIAVDAGTAILIRIGSEDGTTGSGYFWAACEPLTEPPCLADLNGDGVVAGEDLSILLGAWGTPKQDLDGDGSTSGSDLALVLGSWGNCPRP